MGEAKQTEIKKLNLLLLQRHQSSQKFLVKLVKN